nr:immunoglobulin light chain junction region [Macaca mulatta]
CQHYYNTPLAF